MEREWEIIYLSLHCHHQNDLYIKMVSDESHFKFSLIVKDRVTRQCQHTTHFEEKGEPKRILTAVPLLTSLTHYHQAKLAHNVSKVGEVLLYVHRNRWFIRDGSPGRPPRLSHTSWALSE